MPRALKWVIDDAQGETRVSLNNQEHRERARIY